MKVHSSELKQCPYVEVNIQNIEIIHALYYERKHGLCFLKNGLDGFSMIWNHKVNRFLTNKQKRDIISPLTLSHPQFCKCRKSKVIRARPVAFRLSTVKLFLDSLYLWFRY